MIHILSALRNRSVAAAAAFSALFCAHAVGFCMGSVQGYWRNGLARVDNVYLAVFAGIVMIISLVFLLSEAKHEEDEAKL